MAILLFLSLFSFSFFLPSLPSLLCVCGVFFWFIDLLFLKIFLLFFIISYNFGLKFSNPQPKRPLKNGQNSVLKTVLCLNKSPPTHPFQKVSVTATKTGR